MIKQNFKNLIFTLFVVTLLIVISGCLNKPSVNTNTDQEINQETLTTNTPTATTTLKTEKQDPVTIIKDKDGWKTYTNTDWGIRFRFRDEEDEVEFFNHIATITMATADNHLVYFFRDSTKDMNMFDGTLKEFIEKGGWQRRDPQRELSKINSIKTSNGIDGYKVTSLAVYNRMDGEDEVENVDYFLEYNKKSTDIMFDDFDYIHILFPDGSYVSQILDTLEFFD